MIFLFKKEALRLTLRAFDSWFTMSECNESNGGGGRTRTGVQRGNQDPSTLIVMFVLHFRN